MNAVGYISHVVLLGSVALPDRGKHLLAYPSVEFTYAVNLLTGVDSEGRHREFLTFVIGIGASHADELVPRNTEFGRIATHVLAEKTFLEVVVTCRNRCVAGVETRCTHQLDGLVERQTCIDVVAQTLKVAQCGVSLVAVVDVLLDAESLQSEHTTDTEQYLLLQTVLPVASIERVGDRTVELRVQFVVSIEQIERYTTNVHTPNVSVNLIVNVRNRNNQWVSVFVELAFQGQSVEVLRLIVGNLLSVHAQALLEIAETIQETNGTHIHIRVRSLFQIVTGQHSQTARVDLQHLIDTILHREVCHRGALGVRLLVHIVAELLVDVLHLLHYHLVLHDGLLALVAQTLEQQHGIVTHFLVEVLVKALPHVACFVVPSPPHVVCQFVKACQFLRQT